MKITIKAEAKEIADLAVVLQGQHTHQTVIKATTPETIRVEGLKKCIKDTLSTVFDSSNRDTALKNLHTNC